MQVHCHAQPRLEDAQLAIAHRLGLQYMILQRPAMHNVRYSTAMTVCSMFLSQCSRGSMHCACSRRAAACMQEFTNVAILAYECGYTEDTVKQEMLAAPLQDLDLDECLLYVMVVWITLSLTPSRTVVRWATGGPSPACCSMQVLVLQMTPMKSAASCCLHAGDPVSEATMNLWKGFFSLILGAYFEKRMAWFPVDRLQMEVSAMTGARCKG